MHMARLFGGTIIPNNKLAGQILLMMEDYYYPASSTFGEFWFKTVLEQFIQNSGMPLGYRTLKDATDLEDKHLKTTLTKLIGEGYIEELDSPASFLFANDDGTSYSLVLDAEEAEREAEEAIASEAKVPDAAAPEVAQPDTTSS